MKLKKNILHGWTQTQVCYMSTRLNISLALTTMPRPPSLFLYNINHIYKDDNLLYL